MRKQAFFFAKYKESSKDFESIKFLYESRKYKDFSSFRENESDMWKTAYEEAIHRKLPGETLIEIYCETCNVDFEDDISSKEDSKASEKSKKSRRRRRGRRRKSKKTEKAESTDSLKGEHFIEITDGYKCYATMRVFYEEGKANHDFMRRLMENWKPGGSLTEVKPDSFVCKTDAVFKNGKNYNDFVNYVRSVRDLTRNIIKTRENDHPGEEYSMGLKIYENDKVPAYLIDITRWDKEELINSLESDEGNNQEELAYPVADFVSFK